MIVHNLKTQIFYSIVLFLSVCQYSLGAETKSEEISLNSLSDEAKNIVISKLIAVINACSYDEYAKHIAYSTVKPEERQELYAKTLIETWRLSLAEQGKYLNRNIKDSNFLNDESAGSIVIQSSRSINVSSRAVMLGHREGERQINKWLSEIDQQYRETKKNAKGRIRVEDISSLHAFLYVYSCIRKFDENHRFARESH